VVARQDVEGNSASVENVERFLRVRPLGRDLSKAHHIADKNYAVQLVVGVELADRLVGLDPGSV
jgi:hypothetical protein